MASKRAISNDEVEHVATKKINPSPSMEYHLKVSSDNFPRVTMEQCRLLLQSLHSNDQSEWPDEHLPESTGPKVQVPSAFFHKEAYSMDDRRDWSTLLSQLAVPSIYEGSEEVYHGTLQTPAAIAIQKYWNQEWLSSTDMSVLTTLIMDQWQDKSKMLAEYSAAISIADETFSSGWPREITEDMPDRVPKYIFFVGHHELARDHLNAAELKALLAEDEDRMGHWFGVLWDVRHRRLIIIDSLQDSATSIRAELALNCLRNKYDQLSAEVKDKVNRPAMVANLPVFRQNDGWRCGPMVAAQLYLLTMSPQKWLEAYQNRDRQSENIVDNVFRDLSKYIGLTIPGEDHMAAARDSADRSKTRQASVVSNTNLTRSSMPPPPPPPSQRPSHRRKEDIGYVDWDGKFQAGDKYAAALQLDGPDRPALGQAREEAIRDGELHLAFTWPGDQAQDAARRPQLNYPEGFRGWADLRRRWDAIDQANATAPSGASRLERYSGRRGEVVKGLEFGKGKGRHI
jgi:hypothetical protein